MVALGHRRRARDRWPGLPWVVIDVGVGLLFALVLWLLLGQGF